MAVRGSSHHFYNFPQLSHLSSSFIIFDHLSPCLIHEATTGHCTRLRRDDFVSRRYDILPPDTLQCNSLVISCMVLFSSILFSILFYLKLLFSKLLFSKLLFLKLLLMILMPCARCVRSVLCVVTKPCRSRVTIVGASNYAKMWAVPRLFSNLTKIEASFLGLYF